MSKKVLIIVLSIFAILAIMVTGVLIGFSMNTRKETHVESSGDLIVEQPNDTVTSLKEIDYTLGIQNLNDKFTMNNIEVEDLKYTEGKGFKRYSWSTAYDYPIEISYLKISGLKNKQIQDKINERIKELAFHMLPSGEAEKKTVSVDVHGNFANVLSVSASYSMDVQRKPGDPNFNYDSDYNRDYYYGNCYLTFDLTTGNEITLADVFVDNYNFKQLIANKLYNSLAWDYEYQEWIYDPETDTYNPPEDQGRGGLEDRQFILMHQFDKGNYSFAVTQSSVDVSIQNAGMDPFSPYDSTRNVYIGMEAYKDKIAIFNRFQTEQSIFEKGDSDDKRYYFISEYTLKEMHEFDDNLFIYYNEEASYKEGYEIQYQEWLNGRISAEKTYAKQNPSKQLVEFIYHTYDYVGTYPDNAEGYMINIVRAELPKNVFDKASGMDKLINIIRHPVDTEEEDYWYYSDETIAEGFIKYLQDIDTSGSLDIVKGKNGAYYKYDRSYGNYREYLDYDTFFVLPSDEKVLTEEDLKGLDIEALNTAYNEIFARYGHDFTNKSLHSYFLGQLWYAMESGKKVSVEELSDVEKVNLDLISRTIAFLRSGGASEPVTET